MGHTKRLRFAGILGAGLLVLAGEGVAMAQNGVSAGISLSNTIFQQTVGSINAEEMQLFVDTESMANGDIPVTRLRMKEATITDLCMEAPVSLPGLGEKKFVMKVDGPNTQATNLVIGTTSLDGTMTLKNPQIGVDASTMSNRAQPGAFGIQAAGLDAGTQRIKASSITADVLTAAGSKLRVVGGNEGGC
ncbi:DUF6230 family protein [Corynebacterium aquatimens]|uniref:Cholesterol esterase n=1 Tax=Corynebacterium aquatimens TaxID=1190508 RepID=A0A931E0E5_9CORY|nr:DUF6230 family protein [Corynebacterium aquatimens]MBG6121446.1 hypothetical protein [Corynebacterium aquatimens]WJY66010.1 hypothetical protein CAQUA_06530 [Corynebacterium aquatimens]